MALWKRSGASSEGETAAPTGSAGPTVGAQAIAQESQGLSQDEMDRRRKMSRQISATFGEIVSLLMRQQSSKHHTLADLEWLVVPAITTNQFSIVEAQSKAQGFTTPIAVAMWARVSPEVDKRLSEALDRPIRLAPSEWSSGDILWLIEASGEPRALQAMLQRLGKTRWQGHNVKFRNRDRDGRIGVHTLTTQPPTA